MTSAEPSYPASASCPLRVVPPLGLTILHPHPENGTLYLQPSNTKLLLRVRSSYPTKAWWPGGNHSVTFQPECPQEFSAGPGLCQPEAGSESGGEATEPSLYAVLDLNLSTEEQRSPVKVELEAHNNVTEASLSVVVHLEEPLRVLVVQPHPAHRVLMESVVVCECVYFTSIDDTGCTLQCNGFVTCLHVWVSQSYTASVQEGSNPTFKWTVDDKPYFTYYNTVLNVIYQQAATYKLTVSFSPQPTRDMLPNLVYSLILIARFIIS